MDLEFDSCIQIENRIYFFPFGRSLAYYDLVDKTTHYVVTRNEMYEEDVVNSSIDVISDNLIWTTQNGRYLGVYSLLENSMERIELPSVTYKNWSSIICSKIVNDELILIPQYDSFFLKYSLKNKKIDKIGIDFKEYVDDEGISVAKIYKTNLVGISNSTCKLFVFDMINNKIDNSIDLQCEKAVTGYVYEDKFFFLADNGIWKYDFETMRLQMIYKCNIVNGLLIVEKNKFYIFPYAADDIYIYDSVSNEMNKYQGFPQDYKGNDKSWAKYTRYYCATDYIWINSRTSNYMFRINRKNQEIEWMKTPEVSEFDDMCFQIKNIILENSEKELELFLSVINEKL